MVFNEGYEEGPEPPKPGPCDEIMRKVDVLRSEIERERAARLALEDRLDKGERARVYAEDQAAARMREVQATTDKCDALKQSIAARDLKERGKVERQRQAIKDIEARNAKLVERVAAQWARAEQAEYMRDAYCKAKVENDERFMTERDAALHEVARAVAECNRLRTALSGVTRYLSEALQSTAVLRDPVVSAAYLADKALARGE